MKNTPSALRSVPRLALALSALALAGCGHKDTIVGKWQGTVAQPGAALNSTFEFTPDGKETITLNGPSGPGGMPINVVVSGTYTVDGTNLTQTLTTMTMGSRTGPAPPHSSNPAPFTLNGDHLTLTVPTGRESMTLTRMK